MRWIPLWLAARAVWLSPRLRRLFPRLQKSRSRRPAGGAAGAVAEIETAVRLRQAPEEVLTLLARRAAEVVGAQAAAVLTFTPGNNLVVRAASGAPLVDQAGVRLANVDTLAALAAYRQRTYQCDLARRGRRYDTALADRGVRRMLYAPIPGDGRSVGVLALGHGARRRFGARQQDLAALFAGLAAATVRLRPAAGALREDELERAHLARELHDSLAQSLYGISLRAQAAQELLRRDDPAEADAPISQVVEMAASGLAETRGLISDLRPDTLDGIGLTVALGRLLDIVRNTYGISVSAQLTESVPLDTPARQAVCRIAQEALQNAARHAGAGHVALRLYRGQPEPAVRPGTAAGRPVLLEVEDDGCGFEADGKFPGRLGLQSMRERAQAVGGRLDVVSGIGRGTLVRAEFPPTR